MDRDIDLLRYLPPYLQDYMEMYQIMTTENPEFKLIAVNCKRVLNNTFIMYCDKEGIQRFERLLNIVASESDTLDFRKSRVLSKWNDDIPYTLQALMNKLVAIQGDDDIQIVINDYSIIIITHMDKKGQTDTLWDLFETMIPCNMHITHKNYVKCNTGGTSYFAGGMIYSRLAVNEYTQYFNSSGMSYFGFGLSYGRITVNEFTQYFTSSGTAYVGIGTSEVRMMVNEYVPNFRLKGNANLGVGITNTEIIKIH